MYLCIDDERFLNTSPQFMTLRRLNLEIQGFPESYAAAPLMNDNMVVGEPHPLAMERNGVMAQTPMHPDRGPPGITPDPDGLRSSPRASPRSSPVVETQG